MKPYGKTRRLVEHITAVAGPALAEKIAAGLTMPPVGADTREKSAWVREVIARMDALLPEAQRREIMGRRKCPPPKLGVARDQELWAQCDVHGEPVAKGGHRYGGKAYECFCRADMGVFAGSAERGSDR